MSDPVSISAVRFGDQAALVDGPKSVSFARLDNRVNGLCRHFAELGLRRGDRVAILTANCFEWFDATFATMRLGLVRSYINDRLSVPEIARIIDDLDPAAIVATPELVHLVRDNTPTRKLVIAGGRDYDEIVAGDSLTHTSWTPPHEWVELVRYTSGTTGAPKGVLQTRNARLAWTAAALVELRLSEHDVILHASSLNFAAQSMAYLAFEVGAKQVIQRHFDPRECLEIIGRERITATVMVPTMIQKLAECLSEINAAEPAPPSINTSSLSTVLYGAAPFSAEHLRKCLRLFGKVFVGSYGMSEFNCVTFLPRVEHDPTSARLSSCGRPHLLADVRIVEPQGRELGVGELGEIQVRGPAAAAGYLNRPAETAALYQDGGWMVTNDIGYLDSGGYLFIVDRKSDIINSGGFNIYPREVEEALISYPDVAEAVVVGVTDPIWGEQVCALVRLKPDSGASASDLDKWCRERLGHYKVPRDYKFVATELPKNSNGKYDRRAARQLVGQE